MSWKRELIAAPWNPGHGVAAKNPLGPGGGQTPTSQHNVTSLSSRPGHYCRLDGIPEAACATPDFHTTRGLPRQRCLCLTHHPAATAPLGRWSRPKEKALKQPGSLSPRESPHTEAAGLPQGHGSPPGARPRPLLVQPAAQTAETRSPRELVPPARLERPRGPCVHTSAFLPARCFGVRNPLPAAHPADTRLPHPNPGLGHLGQRRPPVPVSGSFTDSLPHPTGQITPCPQAFLSSGKPGSSEDIRLTPGRTRAGC